MSVTHCLEDRQPCLGRQRALPHGNGRVLVVRSLRCGNVRATKRLRYDIHLNRLGMVTGGVRQYSTEPMSRRMRNEVLLEATRTEGQRANESNAAPCVFPSTPSTTCSQEGV